jgi:hypothetical protein
LRCDATHVCKTCVAGEEGCACANESCSTSLTCNSEHLCVKTQVTATSPSLKFPDKPKCYTPCQKSIVKQDGNLATCGPDGLIDGCLDSLTCISGSCAQAGEGPRTCASDTDCPQYQGCFEGFCAANCSQDSECTAGLKCANKVCRTPCSVTSPTCGTQQICSTFDGTNGFCAEFLPREEDKKPAISGSFAVSETTLMFSPLNPSASFVITNESLTSQTFVVARTEELGTLSNGLRTRLPLPLQWLKFGLLGKCSMLGTQSDLSVTIAAGKTATIEICNTVNTTKQTWDGTLSVSNPQLGKQQIQLSYSGQTDGRWVGKMYYFANFEDTGLDAWLKSSPGNINALNTLPNAFLRRYAEFRLGHIPVDEFRAMLLATETGAWNFPSVRSKCPQDRLGGACYVCDNPQGIATYATRLESQAIPTGVIELPLAMTLQKQGAIAGCSDTAFQGKIVSQDTLHYPGDPQVNLTFAGDPQSCYTGLLGARQTAIKSFSATSFLAGRFASYEGDAHCDGDDKQLTKIPWLIPGFIGSAKPGADNDSLYKMECRTGGLLPLGNPVPDGRTRALALNLVDGVMIDQQTIFLIFKGTFSSFKGGSNFSSYGYTVLERAASAVDPSDFMAATSPTPSPLDDATARDVLLGDACPVDVVQAALGNTSTITSARTDELMRALIFGVTSTTNPVVLSDKSKEKVHYLCEFDGASYFDSVAGPGFCPEGSVVTYFTLTDDTTELSKHACTLSGTCFDTFDDWQSRKFAAIRLNPIYHCNNDAAICDNDRSDLRKSKTFYAAASNNTNQYVPLDAQINQAFRYKSQFISSSGTMLGLTPTICANSRDVGSYCYDPQAIESIGKRVQCILNLFDQKTSYDALTPTTQSAAKTFLQQTFGQVTTLGGFEFLNAELQIMLGDDAFTEAFAARFDLAQASVHSFPGSTFEAGGIDLSGPAGFEMYKLYQAAQYYQLVLDRFFSLAIYLDQPGKQFIGQNSVTTYYNKLMRASVQRARAFSEIAIRYQNFNRPDLAKRVIARSYVQTYLESALFSRLMRQILDQALPQEKNQIERDIELAQHGYSSSLLSMRDGYKNLSAQLNFFGFGPDEIPFPALGANDGNAFLKAMALAKDDQQIASAKETLALQMMRDYAIDQATFPSQLATLQNSYDKQLSSLCGTFLGSDGAIYPATKQYASFSDILSVLGEPCGLIGTGQIWDARANVDLARLDVLRVQQDFASTQAQIDIESELVAKQCQLGTNRATFELSQHDQKTKLQELVDGAQNHIDDLRLTQQAAQQEVAVQTACSASLGISGGFNFGIGGGATIGGSVSTNPQACGVAAVQKPKILSAETQINRASQNVRNLELQRTNLEKAEISWNANNGCEIARANSAATVKKLALHFADIAIEATKIDYNIRIALARVSSLEDEAKRLMAEQSEAERLSLDVQAARNNPDIRIYKNDAVRAAESTFQDALASAYRTTKVFEYFTSQSYGHFGDLFLVRMASSGDNSLESYLAALNKEYVKFSDNHGNPALRVAVLSLRDDILLVPRVNTKGDPLSLAERTRLFRTRMSDVALLDEFGDIRIPFATSDTLLSPKTRVHKIFALEAEIDGASIGDDVGRLYLVQRGTGIVRRIEDGQKVYFALPQRVAVINTSFNGRKTLDPGVYRNDFLRDRPVLNTSWDLLFNQKDEIANQDIELNSLSDIRLYIYYTDFTAL